ncbi:MAG: hypothetical protein A2426_07640 [Candidatus Lambdaproteobacteria bacterium RIFOXYC1_FULL_56_13]|nr:MAG: hypothetical protein A2426_07640 [Candidatus Lambdaproteobacteria bacterium RIFOXYC1_FULL_56_13]
MATQWDHQSIERAYQDLIDPLGRGLDQAQVLGLAALLGPEEPLVAALDLYSFLEQELLLQWKTKKDQAMEGLLAHQRVFVQQQSRGSQGLWDRYHLFRSLLLAAAPPLGPSPWLSYLCDLLANQDIYAKLGLGPKDRLPLVELGCQLAALEPREALIGLLNLTELGNGPRVEPPPLCRNLPPRSCSLAALHDLFDPPQPEAVLAKLEAFWEKNSGGLFSRHKAFLYRQDTQGVCALQGDEPKKWTPLEGLFGIDEPLAKLREMTERFLGSQGFTHILLWGARGMGKSSAALGLLEAYWSQGLRLVEVSQGDLGQLPRLFGWIEGKKEKFVLFLDDFGFEPGHPEFKALKSIFEGSLEQMPKNLMLLATSNKVNLVSTLPLDPTLPGDRQQEDEARALGDRFGLKLHFDRPVFEELEKLFVFLCGQKGAAAKAQEWWPEFLRFAAHNHHDKPSGRTIEQFLANRG